MLSYSEIAGSMPMPATAAHDRWRRTLLNARINYCLNWTRTGTYYFAQAGSDTSPGDGTLTHPFKTLAKAATLLAANKTFLFNRGDVWAEQQALAVVTSGTQIGAYGNGAKPLINYFTTAITANNVGWSATDGKTKTFKIDMATDIAWVRETLNRLTYIYSRQDSIAHVEANASSFWWDSGTNKLYLHPRGDTSPINNAIAYEALPSNTGYGISLSATSDGCVVRDIRIDGCGMDRVNRQTQHHAFHSLASTTCGNLFLECEAYFTSSHSIASQSGTGYGGRDTFVRCKVGLLNYNSSGGENPLNSYSLHGENEVYWYECEATYGTLPSYDLPADIGCVGFLVHTGGTDHTTLLICERLNTVGGTYACRMPWAFGAPAVTGFPAATVLADCRAFVIDPQVAYPGTNINLPLPVFGGDTGVAVIGGDLYLTPSAYTLQTTGYMVTGSPHGWWINGTIRLDLTNGPTGAAAVGWFNGDGTTDDMQMWNTRIDVLNNPIATTGAFALNYDGIWGTPGTSVAKNCLFQNINPVVAGTTFVGLHTLATNAYYGITESYYAYNNGWHNDATKVLLQDPIAVGHIPDPASPLYRSGTVVIARMTDGRGFNRATANAPTIGPIESGEFGLLRVFSLGMGL